MSVSKSAVDAIIRRPYTIEFDYPEDPKEGILAYVAEWPDVFAAGRTREEAVKELSAALRSMVSFHLEHRLGIPEPLSEYGGRVLVQMPRSLHRRVVGRARSEGVSMNQWISTTIAGAIGATPRSSRKATKTGKKKSSSRKTV